MKDTFIIHDRYSATGTPYPDPATMCLGQCEGMGLVPIHERETEEPWRSLWLAEEAKAPYRKRAERADRDGYHFVVCPDCNGTRLRPPSKAPYR